MKLKYTWAKLKLKYDLIFSSASAMHYRSIIVYKILHITNMYKKIYVIYFVRKYDVIVLQIKNLQNPIIFLATSFKSGKVALPLKFFSLLASESR